jgi:restriction endonuclease S subunit
VSGWPVVPLESLAADQPRAITDGPFGSNLARQHYTATGPQVVRLQNIGDGIYIQSPAHISEAHFESLRAHEVQPGDLLVASLGEILPRACLAPVHLGPAIVKADCIRVRLSESVDRTWVMYSMQRPEVRRWADDQRHGVGRPRLGLAVIRRIPIPLPSRDEQHRIVAALEEHLASLEEGVRSLALASAKIRAVVRAILLELIPDVARWPKGWQVATVGSAGRVELGRQRHPDWHHGANMHPYLRVANVFEDRIDTSDVMEMHWEEDTFQRFKMLPGQILLNEGQSPQYLGRPAMYRGEPADVAFTNSLIRFTAGPDVVPEFALLVFRRHMHAGRFARESRITTNIAHLSATRLKEVEFPIPPRSEQENMVALAADRLEAVRRLGDQVGRQGVRASGLRRSLFSAAFSGRLLGGSSDTDVIEQLAEEDSA